MQQQIDQYHCHYRQQKYQYANRGSGKRFFFFIFLGQRQIFLLQIGRILVLQSVGRYSCPCIYALIGLLYGVVLVPAFRSVRIHSVKGIELRFHLRPFLLGLLICRHKTSVRQRKLCLLHRIRHRIIHRWQKRYHVVFPIDHFYKRIQGISCAVIYKEASCALFRSVLHQIKHDHRSLVITHAPIIRPLIIDGCLRKICRNILCCKIFCNYIGNAIYRNRVFTAVRLLCCLHFPLIGCRCLSGRGSLLCHIHGIGCGHAIFRLDYNLNGVISAFQIGISRNRLHDRFFIDRCGRYGDIGYIASHCSTISQRFPVKCRRERSR